MQDKQNPSLPFPAKSRIQYALLSGVLGLGIFFVDIFLPRGIAVGLLYIIIVLLSLKTPFLEDTIYAATLSTVFSILDYIISSPAVPAAISLTNRTLYIAAIWVAALVCIKQKRSEKAQQDMHRRLLEMEVNDHNTSAAFTLTKFLSNLLSLGILANSLQPDSSSETPPVSRPNIEKLLAHIHQALDHAKQLSEDLNTTAMSKTNLVDMVDHVTTEIAENRGIQYDVNYSSTEMELPPSTLFHLQRILNAALRYAVDHRNATEVEVNIEKKPAGVSLRVTDNGQSNVTASEEAFDLLQMIGVRAGLIGASLEMKKQAAVGMSLECTIAG